MKVSKLTGLLLGFWLACGLSVLAVSLEYSDGLKFEGEIVTGTPSYLQVRTGNGYTNLEWGKFSQTTLQELKELAATNSSLKKISSFIEPYLEIPEDEIIKKTQVVIKPVPRLERPEKGALLGAMFKSSVGLLCLILLYAANIYAGYEIACVRAYPPAMVCGIAAVAPVVGPVVFLCLPTKMPAHQGDVEEESVAPTGEAPAQSAAYAEGASETPPGSAGASAAAAPTAHPQTQVFKRGQFTFNRRFIETKFSTFFGTVRRGDDRDLVLLIKSVRGEYVATRITRIASNDMHLEVHKGAASQEIQMPFAEIQEVHLKHKDA